MRRTIVRWLSGFFAITQRFDFVDGLELGKKLPGLILFLPEE